MLEVYLHMLGLAFVLMLRLFFPEVVLSTDLLSFEHPLVLLFCLQRTMVCNIIFTKCIYLYDRLELYFLGNLNVEKVQKALRCQF